MIVVSRSGFIETLEDVLSFTPKVCISLFCVLRVDVHSISQCSLYHAVMEVDFNAGVVAAGESQIESTVTGNVSKTLTCDEDSALKDQSQIYLPINNALTKVG